MSIKGFEEKRSNNNWFYFLELGDTELMNHADGAMGKTKMSEPEAPEGE